MRVLLLADQCHPTQPSLPVVGYKYAKALAEVADVTVATQVRNRDAIEGAGGIGRARVEFLDTEFIASPMYRLAQLIRGGNQVAWTVQMAMDYPSYVAFELAAWARFRNELSSFDVVHRITPMSPTLPSPMARLSPVPFVLGPLNGNLVWPRQFQSEMRKERELLSRARSAYKLLPFARSTYGKSAAILAAFRHTIDDLPPQTLDKVINFPEVGIDPDMFQRPVRTPREKKSILFAGRMVPYKIPETVVRAVAESPVLQQHRTIFLGDGPELSRLREIAGRSGVNHCIEFRGRVSQAEVGQAMQEAEIFAFPSIRELGAGVVVEAMACGMACVVVDYGGPGTLIDADRGIKVPLGSLEELVGRFRAALEELVQTPGRAESLGAQAHKHALRYYAWTAKAHKTLEVYEWVRDGCHGPRPDFWD